MRIHPLALTLLLLPVAACTGAATPAAADTAAAPAAEAGATPVAQAADTQVLPRMRVHKTATCGCCGKWVEHMQRDGFEVETIDVEDLATVKTRLGVPDAMASCHTAEIDGYFVEGHVPAADVRRLLAERPDARGIAAPGMPMGSPGMEMPDGRSQAYTVELVANDGTHRPFAEHPAR
ncbi:DUF411 domain-containing protein [Luteimonas sp. RC10]|uniref:DUF411 domain-containing protein n=1 Tax=Luteimonas sp. RC10 TaxID=2587035 RepID=UPI00184A2665|nr:DUF411 domain-containing protein [Luteimonas sp. RC10]MBB3344880.1 hypothetical protein [Luteimonas sp. RC10]